MDFEIKFQSPFLFHQIVIVKSVYLTFSIAEDIIEKGSPLGAGGLISIQKQTLIHRLFIKLSIRKFIFKSQIITIIFFW